MSKKFIRSNSFRFLSRLFNIKPKRRRKKLVIGLKRLKEEVMPLCFSSLRSLLRLRRFLGADINKNATLDNILFELKDTRYNNKFDSIPKGRRFFRDI